MSEQEVEPPYLDGWPSVSMETLGVRPVTSEEFRELVIHGGTDSLVYALETAPGGTAEARLVGSHRHRNAVCRNFLSLYLPKRTCSWEAEQLFLINQPCYIAAGSGVILLEDGRIVLETLFPTGKSNLADAVGGGLAIDNIEREMQGAPHAPAGVWAPLLSLGSIVYGHAFAESLVQNSALQRAGLSPLISYVATSWAQKAQLIALAQAHSPVVRFPSALVKVPRAIFASKLYRHPPLGTEFRLMVEGIKAGAASTGLAVELNDKIYVSRLHVPNRRMTNEPELIERLWKMGFRIVAGEKMSFEEQVQTFRNARLIVGPYGSGLVNAAFAAPNAALLELRSLNNPDNSPNWDDFYLALAATMDIAYGIHVVYSPPDADNWECNISGVLGLIRAAAEEIGGITFQNDGEAGAEGPEAANDELEGEASGFWSIPDHTGEDYYSFLGRLHENLQPRSYLEIGAEYGDTFGLAGCASIGIDSNFQLTESAIGTKPICCLFRMKSDTFFANHDARLLLGDVLEIAFLNGPHRFENVLNDVLSLEKQMDRRSIILINNAIPTDAYVARRLEEDQTLVIESAHPDWWAGDVWKAVVLLKKYRPDLTIHAFGSYPTGLVAITNLNPAAEVRDYSQVAAEYAVLDLRSYGVDKYVEELAMRDPATLADFDSITALFRPQPEA